MVTVETVYNEEVLVAVRVSGHAGAGKKGEDIVCAAVSALCQQLSISLTRLTDFKGTLTGKPGRFEVRLAAGEISDQRIKLLMDSFLLGITGTANAHPKQVIITRKTER